jgi:Cu+-exporting ATPase
MENHTTELKISGMTCNNCARHVGEALRGVPGVQMAEVQLDENAATVRWKNGQGDPHQLIAAVEEAGYKASVRTEDEKGASKWSPVSGWLFNVVFGMAVTIPLMVCEWVFGTGMERWYQWLSFALVLPLQLFGGLRFYHGAWQQLKMGQSNMDTLVALGSTTAFLYSTWGLFAGWSGHLFFMDAAAIITLVSFGHFLESKASAQAASSLRALLKLAPQTARRLNTVKQEEVVPVEDLRLADSVILKPGDRVPTDGEVIEGGSSVDESMLTGESMPVEKSAGGKLFAGTINQSGQLIMRVTATGDETALAHIIQIVQQAQTSRASIQKLGDKVSSVFVPIVIAIATLTGLWWGLAPESAGSVRDWLGQYLWLSHFQGDPLASAIYHAAAVLIIACPCAMGLATPVAIMAGTNAAARRGILIRDGAALEKSGTISAVLFDKTGTLTEGKVSVAAVETFQTSKDEFARTAAGLTKGSNHPLSRALAGMSENPTTFDNWKEIRGAGLQGDLSGKLYRLGSLKWLAENGTNIEAGNDFIEKWSSQGATISGVSMQGDLAGLIALKDQLKPHAKEIVTQLLDAGKQVYLVTGDNRRTAIAVATQVGIPEKNVFAEVRPEGKVEVIKTLQTKGERVAFAGDGINDAPALEQADLGIALMNASDVARESADLILLKADLEAIPEALGLAQATLRTIKQNLFWAFFYNAAGVPLAAIGFLSPVFSAFAMGMSDLVVIGNALRLRGWRGKK